MATPDNTFDEFEDSTEMLKADHQKVRDLFQQYMAASDQTAKQHIAEQVFVELEIHAQLEETVFYPAFEAAADEEGKQLIEEARQEHQTVKDLIAELRDLAVTDKFDARFRELMENVEHHVQEEEREMFPEAAELLAEDDAELMDEMQEMKEQLQAL
jgi:hemerythrin superfamily protein